MLPRSMRSYMNHDIIEQLVLQALTPAGAAGLPTGQILAVVKTPETPKANIHQIMYKMIDQGKLQRVRWGTLRVWCKDPIPSQVKEPRIDVPKATAAGGIRKAILDVAATVGTAGMHRKDLQRKVMAAGKFKATDYYHQIHHLIACGEMEEIRWKWVRLTNLGSVSQAIQDPVQEPVLEPAPPPKKPRKRHKKPSPTRDLAKLPVLDSEAEEKGMIGRVFQALTLETEIPMEHLSLLTHRSNHADRMQAARETVGKLQLLGLVERAPSKLYRVVEGKKWEDLTEDALQDVGTQCQPVLRILSEAGRGMTILDLGQAMVQGPVPMQSTWVSLQRALTALVKHGRIQRYERGVYGLPGLPQAQVPTPPPGKNGTAAPGTLRRLILKGMRSQGAPMRLKDICAWVGPHATTYENPAILRVAVSIQLGLLVKARQVVRIQQGVYAPRQQKGNGTRQVEA